MPKIVDPAERRRLVVEAVWRVVQRDGLENASVRNVAREADLSMGALRHYFPTHSALITFALQVIMDRIEARVAALEPADDPRERADMVLAELLPLDAERRAENNVWLAYTARAVVDPDLHALQNESYDKLLDCCRYLVQELVGDGLTASEVEVEAERLHALIDGLAVHAATHPERNGPERIRSIMGRHLDGLEASRR
jgi:AcrR family transcriptional regulator